MQIIPYICLGYLSQQEQIEYHIYFTSGIIFHNYNIPYLCIAGYFIDIWLFLVFSIQFSSVQFSSVVQSCPTLCNPMNHSTPGLPAHHQLLEFTQTHVHRVNDHLAISSSVIPFSSCPQSLPASESFSVSQLST